MSQRPHQHDWFAAFVECVEHRPAGVLAGEASPADHDLLIEADGGHKRTLAAWGRRSLWWQQRWHTAEWPSVAVGLRQRRARRDDVDALAGGEVPLVARIGGRRAEHVDVPADDRAAGIGRLEPTAVDCGVRRYVDMAAHRDHARVDRDAPEILQRAGWTGSERDPGRRRHV